nr:DUF4276 family protein [Streptomyces sp. LBL]
MVEDRERPAKPAVQHTTLGCGDHAARLLRTAAGQPWHGGPAERISHPRFIPYLVLHETETWVFAAAEQLADWYDDAALGGELKRQVDAAGGPEGVNDGADTAPSKRLLRLRPGYLKTQDGPVAVTDLGLPSLRAACPHFDTWIGKLLALTSL